MSFFKGAEKVQIKAMASDLVICISSVYSGQNDTAWAVPPPHAPDPPDISWTLQGDKFWQDSSSSSLQPLSTYASL